MIVEWIPSWYELDQCIVVGDVDLFYLSNENCFADDFNRDADEVRAEILTPESVKFIAPLHIKSL